MRVHFQGRESVSNLCALGDTLNVSNTVTLNKIGKKTMISLFGLHYWPVVLWPLLIRNGI